jgi:hypothetical protein
MEVLATVDVQRVIEEIFQERLFDT